jgi:hypothetical protein
VLSLPPSDVGNWGPMSWTARCLRVGISARKKITRMISTSRRRGWSVDICELRWLKGEGQGQKRLEPTTTTWCIHNTLLYSQKYPSFVQIQINSLDMVDHFSLRSSCTVESGQVARKRRRRYRKPKMSTYTKVIASPYGTIIY